MNNILLIEDNEEMRENIEEILQLANYNVISAVNGKDGVIKALEFIPDIIICDIMMPEMDGYETLYILNKNPKTNTIPFIFLTAKSEKTDLRRGMNLGADDYLTKPFEEIELLNAIETRINRNKNLKESSTNPDPTKFMNIAREINELKSLNDNKKTRVYNKKEIIYHEGDEAYHLYFIKKGKVRTYKINNDLKELTTGLYNEGEYFGYMELFNNTDHPDYGETLEETEIIKIPKIDFQNLVYNNREVAHYFIKLLSGNLIEKEIELIKLAYNSIRKRVADSLLYLNNKYKKDEVFSISIPRNDLASMVGGSTESVIRILSDFKEEKLIKVNGSKITIININKLASVFN
jgi:CRP/FNR family transcriptional regulator, polysaccharide utilization system transcription regulator